MPRPHKVFIIIFSFFIIEELLNLQTPDTHDAPHNNSNCLALIDEALQLLEKNNITKTCSLLKKSACSLSHDVLRFYARPETVFSRASSCNYLEFPEKTSGFDKEEEEYPLAFSILTHGDARQFELLIRKIYRPFNLYCIHIDPRTDTIFQNTINLIISCYEKKFTFKNIFLVENPIPIYWGHLSLQEADLLCMKTLLKKSTSWKALVTLSGSEFPRYDNLEFVWRSKEAKGAYIEAYPMKQERYNERLQYYWKLNNTEFHPERTTINKPVKTSEKRPKPPFGLKIYTGTRICILSRTWVWFLLFHPVSTEFLDWSRDSANGDEHFVHTITKISKVMFINNTWVVEQEEVQRDVVPRMRTNIWGGKEKNCYGIWRNNICVLTMRELSFILDPGNKALVANKFQSNVDPWVVPCFGEMIGQQTF